MKTWRFTRILSMILVLAMLTQMMPVQAFATSGGSNALDVEAEQPVTTILGEVEDLREEDTKHFRMSDGSYIAVSYGMPVHYEDEEGNWEDINNTIVQNSDTSTYQLNREDAVVAFANALTDGTVLTTSVGDKSITMSILDTHQAVMMIAGKESAELMSEEEAEVLATETVPEKTVEEIVPEETEPVTEPEETVAETEPGETFDETEETVLETTAATVVEEERETVEEAVETVVDASETAKTEYADAAASTNESAVEETQAEETESEETVGETAETVTEDAEASAEAEETTAATIPEETEAPTVPEETTIPTVPEETEAATEPEETVPETTSTATESIGEMDADAVVTPVVAGGITFDRTATAEIAAEIPTMLSLQENYSWNVEDIIPEKLQSSLLYENVFPDTDLLYTAFGHNIKEQIVINKAQATYRYDFLLDLDNLTAALNEDGSVSFVDAESNLVYRIPVPFMEDEAGVLSDAVEFVLNETNQGLVLTVEADAAWINAEEREFPVKIDPSFIIYSGSALDEIYSAYTMEAAPNDTTLGRQYLYVGAQPYSTSNDGRYRTFMHFNDMPAIPAGYEVVGAQLQLYQQLYTQRDCSSFPVGIYEVTTSLPSSYSSYYNWFSAMTWRNNMPSYDESNAIDYVMVDSTKGYRYWNITELVKKWYAEGTDNTTCALVMMNESDIDTYYYYASVAFLAYASTIPPILIVSYRNNTGIEPYYTYATLGGAAAGTAYVADATGQLKVGKELVSYASSTNPFSLNLIYNSDYFTLASGTDYQPPSKLGLSMNVGSGWTLDYIQKVEAETIDNIDYLKYTDGDGTIHYFMEDSTPDDSNYPYYDEDGLGLKMKINSTNNYTMADDDGNEWTFTNNYLTSVKDSDGNKINVTYSNGRITTITQLNKDQAEINLATFAYNGNELASVTDNAGNVYTLVYSSGKLSSIKKNNVTIAAYTYDGYRLTKMTDSESSYSLAFTYASGKVSSYKELGGSTTGATVAVTYPSHSRTTYRDYGQDRTANTEDDILTHYLFDYARRTANAYTTDNTGVILGATNAAYYERTSTDESNDKRNNRTVRSASIGLASQQLLKNTSIESTSNAWTFSGASRATTNPRTGAYSIKGTLTSNETQYAMKSSETLTAGKTYTVSAYVNTSDVTRFDGAGVSLMVTDGSQSWNSNYVNYITSDTVDDGWVRISVTFKAPSTDTYGITIFNSGSIGTVYADDIQMEEAEAPSSYNLLENGSMEMSSYGWTMGNGAAYSTSDGVAASSTSLKINGNPTDQTTNAYQDVTLNLPASQTYVLSGWVNANAVPDEDDNKETDLDNRSKECGLRAIITYSDDETETHYVPFNTDLTDTWQFVSLAVVPKETTKTVSKIRVVCAYEGNANAAYFDNISLVREAAQTMRYDEDGNLVSVETPGLDEDVNTYENGNLIKTVTGGYGTYKYTYDSTYKHRLTSVTNDLITQSMTYDSAGNAITTKLAGSGTKTINTSATYDDSKNRLVSITDATGATVTYGYGTNNAKMMALPTSITDPNGTVTSTEYDSNYRVTETSIEDLAELVYNYTNGNLSSVQRTNNSNITQAYNFTYDAFGNMTALKVGTQTLATYTYGSGNGLLQTQTYANGDSVSFTYDKLGRTKTATYSDGLVLTYVYNGEGNLHSLAETKDGTSVTYLYNYDSIGRLINSEKQDGTAATLHTHQVYNAYNQLTKQSWQIGGDAYAENYTYNSADGSLNTFTVERNGTELAEFTMNYDDLRRLSSASSDIFNKNYTYRDISDSNTTTQVSAVDYYRTSYGYTYKFAGYSYTYDELGNILSVTDSIGNTTTYTYDDQGQLLTESGNVGGFNSAPYSYSKTYTYDSVGNILSSSDGTTTHSYTYNNSNWKDLLTAYDGESIIYDASGNPTSYFNGNRWTMEWENGRQLTSLSRRPPVVITTQPENSYSTVGTTATFTVAAEGDRVTYQWQYSTDDGETWNNVSSGISATLSVSAQASVDGNLYRCVVKDFMGHTATSQAGKLTVTSAVSTLDEFNPEFTIINEPDDYYGRVGDTATFIVETAESGLGYQWLCKAPDSDTFEYLTSSDAYTSTLRVPLTAENIGAEFRCFITDAYGDVGSTRVAAIKLDVLDWDMEYDASGLRTKRISDDKTYTYTYAGDKLLRMTAGSDTLDFSYDVNGHPLTMTHNGTVYSYITNLQGDVMSVQDSYGGSVAQYAYDAWGNILEIQGTHAELNPLRYRGYVYDQETGFYYLQNRYYDPTVGRFLNADELSYLGADGSLLSYNVFAYCSNNPMNRTDDLGNLSLPNWAKFAIGTVATVAAVTVTVATGGAALPVLAGVAFSTVGGAVGGYLTNGKQGAIDGAANGLMLGGLGSLATSAIGAIKTVSTYKKTIDTYSALTKQYKGSGMEAHHIIEKRLVKGSSWNINKMPSIELSKTVHKGYTKAWRNAVPYGTRYSSGIAYKYKLYKASNAIYQNNRVLKMAARYTIWKM